MPRALQIILDDAGWWGGANDMATGGPVRTAIPRGHVPADYQALIDLGKALGMKPLCAFILCEWDRENILRGCPTATWMGENWRNPYPRGPMEIAADILRRGKDHIELGLHGVGHEYWHRGTGIGERGEFGDDDNAFMRPADDIRRHLDHFGRILAQWNLGGFPTAMFPPGARYRYAPSGESAASVFAEFGIRYINEPLNSDTDWHEEPIGPTFGADHGVLVTDRSPDMFRYNELDTVGHTGRLHRITGNSVGMHWPNTLSIDPARNGEVVSRWVEALRVIACEPDVCLGQDTPRAMSQEPYRWLTAISEQGPELCFDFTKVDALPTRHITQSFYFKTAVPLRTGIHRGLEVSAPLHQGSQPYFLYQIRRLGGPTGALDRPNLPAGRCEP
jgi:hypothetical protein